MCERLRAWLGAEVHTLTNELTRLGIDVVKLRRIQTSRNKKTASRVHAYTQSLTKLQTGTLGPNSRSNLDAVRTCARALVSCMVEMAADQTQTQTSIADIFSRIDQATATVRELETTLARELAVIKSRSRGAHWTHQPTADLTPATFIQRRDSE